MQIAIPELFGKASLRLFEALNTPRALSCAILMRYEEFGQLVNLTTDPRSYEDPQSYYRDCVATDWVRKCAGLPTGIDTPAVARQDFLECEKVNARTNARLAPFIYNGPFTGPSDERIGGFLHSVKKVIRDILGPLPLDLDGKFGPGSTFEDRGQLCTLPDKISSRPTVTSGAHCFTDLWGDTLWSRALTKSHPYRSGPKRVRGNRFTTVPKDAKKDRGIAIEPSLNVYYQLAVGRHIRGRLRLNGIDLKGGQTIHQQFAEGASADPDFRVPGGMATIDLKSASDSVSRNLVKLLLPEEWYTLLASLRSPATRFAGRWYYLEKFSSMGNGFTFELETLIFLSVALAVCGSDGHPGHTVLVYGDDIIVPTKHASTLLSVLRFLGFTANPQKTYLDSHFRESCGGDFFRGKPVRAHFVKELPSEPQHWIAIANGLHRVQKSFDSMGISVTVRRAWLCLLDAIPSQIRSCRGPAELGDLVITDDDYRNWIVKIEDGTRYVRVWRPVHSLLPFHHWRAEVVLAYAVYGASSSGVSPRDNVSGYKHDWTAFS